MKILYVSQYFPPEKCAPAARVSELAQRWSKNGHDITVLTGFPNHPTGILHPDYRKRFRRLLNREQSGDVHVVRTWLWPLPNANIWKRVICYLSFFLSACVAGLFCRRPDVLIATSPQLLVGVSGWFLAHWFEVPFVLEIRDLWPESLGAVGARGCRTQLYRAVGRLAGFLYKRADQIVVVTPAFHHELVTRWDVPARKISVVENGIEPELFSPTGPGHVRSAFALEGKFVVSYIGTLGMAHGLETVLRAAELLRTRCPAAHILLMGDGAERSAIEKEAATRSLHNVSLLPSQPHEDIPAFVRASDICLVTLKKADAFRSVIPSKMLEFMACGRAVVLSVEGQAAEILQQANAGVSIEPEAPEQLADAILSLYRQSDLRGRMGANGRAYVRQRFTRERTAAKYIVVLQSVLKDAETRRFPQPAQVPRATRM